MKRAQQEKYIRERNFEDLFIEQGWDEAHAAPVYLPYPAGEKFKIQAKFQKRGFAVCFCQDQRFLILSTADRKRLLHELSKFHYEHLLIAYGKNADGANEQHWMVSIRPKDRPQRVAMVQWCEDEDQALQGLIEKLEGLIFPLAEEDALTIVDVVERVRFAFSANAEKISKTFYREFQTELKRFDGFISGLENIVGKKEYAALMLNRLMFIYFIQKKRFLNGETDYLQKRLQKTQQRYGNDQFFDKFYREFLRRLFHEGLDTPSDKRSDEINQLLGEVPYLNGGLFDSHTLESKNSNIHIPDAAFKALFTFFDRYNWHLDDRPAASGSDINPEVLGYIFEKYINDRAQMGAYYTQEDITGYIAKNTILPFLLRRTRENCRNAFAPSGIWRLLQENPDHYIYPAVKHGCEVPDEQLPEDIRRGIAVDPPQLRQRRKEWNTPAPETFALPSETWREVIARRARCADLRQKLQAGEIQTPDDLITYNLDITRFVGDAIMEYEGADFIAALFRAIAGVREQWVQGTNEKVKRGISVLDPACGSGAFLFAALNVLEPLYEGCIERMEQFVADDDAKQKTAKQKKHPLFRKVLEEIDQHPNRRYWIFKTIILENLYGVDIMAEAVEIAKLRLFLKLAAEAECAPDEKNLGLEPLPDIDYNIRTGNSLVGFASMQQFESFARAKLILNKTSSGSVHEQGKFDLSSGLLDKVREQAQTTQQANNRFRLAQDRGDGSYVIAKHELAEELSKLNEMLNQYLADDYGIGKDKQNSYKEWKDSHKPFHWFADFYGIIEGNGGFDVVIGNPPYVEMRQVNYVPQRLKCFDSSAIHAMCIERSIGLNAQNGTMSMISPMSLISTQRMKLVRQLLEENRNCWYSNFSWRPAKLFDEVNRAMTIFIAEYGSGNKNFSTGYIKWNSSNRILLMKTLRYIECYRNENVFWIPKAGDNQEITILKKYLSQSKILKNFSSPSNHLIYYRTTGGLYWKVFTDFSPVFLVNGVLGHSTRENFFSLTTKKHITAAIAVLSSDVFWWWYTITSNLRDLNPYDWQNFPVPESAMNDKKIENLGKKYIKDIKNNSKMRVRKQARTGRIETQSFNIKNSKHIIDEIDSILAEHYGFTDEELDYIINYDYKYRMGGSNE